MLHAELAHAIACLGHGDMLVIGDVGLPIPPGPRRIDLALTPGIPAVSDVLRVVLAEMQAEKAVIATEAVERSSGQRPAWCSLPIEPQAVPHEAFKRLTQQARVIARTGECTPYANDHPDRWRDILMRKSVNQQERHEHEEEQIHSGTDHQVSLTSRSRHGEQRSFAASEIHFPFTRLKSGLPAVRQPLADLVHTLHRQRNASTRASRPRASFDQELRNCSTVTPSSSMLLVG